MVDNEHVALYESLQAECCDNKQYFESQTDDKSRKLHAGFVRLEEQILNLLPLLKELREVAPKYDFRDVPANGYRSFIKAADNLSRESLKICKNVHVHRTSLFFQKTHYGKELDYCIQVFSSLNGCFQLLRLQRTYTGPHALFLDDPDKIDAIVKYMNKIDTKSFYGRFIGFQFGESVQPILKTIAIMMAAFSEYYFHEKNLIQCAAFGGEYFAKPEIRAECLSRITDYRETTVYFCKSFWNITEHDIAKKMNVLFEPIRFINERFELPSEPLLYRSDDGSCVNIDAPRAYIGNVPLGVHLFCSIKRKGMEYFKRIKENGAPMNATSDWLILHVHGGGFIAQTSESHQLYLKDWSRWTNDTPILSVDYSLAPEAPYPRASEEVLYAYVWALNNCERLGTTAKRIVFAGDSAGGNLCISLALKCIELNIRKPDGVFSAYGPTILQFYPSPSRFLGLMDPLLSFGFMMCAIKAYVLTKDSLSSTSSVNGNVRENRSSTLTECSVGEEEHAENQSSQSFSNDIIFDATSDNSPSPVFELSPDDEHHLPSGDVNKNAPPVGELGLPAKYKSILKSFGSNLKEKFNLNDVKTDFCRHVKGNRVPDFINVSSISQLVVEAQDCMFLSPAKAPDDYVAQFPAMSILEVEMDPCIDDSVTWAKKLDQCNRAVHFDVLPNMSHGFLNFSLSSKEAYYGSMLCAQRIRELLAGEPHKSFQKMK